MAGRSIHSLFSVADLHIPFAALKRVAAQLQLDRDAKRELRLAVREHNYQLFVQRFEQRQQHRRDAA